MRERWINFLFKKSRNLIKMENWEEFYSLAKYLTENISLSKQLLSLTQSFSAGYLLALIMRNGYYLLPEELLTCNFISHLVLIIDLQA